MFRFKDLIVLGLVFCTLASNAQDFGEEGETQPLEKAEFGDTPLDPYRLTFRIRPLSYFLFPVTTGRLGSFNARVDYAFTRRIAVGLEGNYFYVRPFAGSQLRAEVFSIRLDANYFLFKPINMDRYAEGFHAGAYYKYRYDDSFGPSVTAAYGTSRVIQSGHVFGPIIGWQYVKNKFVFDQSIGFGLGLASSNVGILIVPDFRLGLSIGTVVLQ
jgi:hypothetical protein